MKSRILISLLVVAMGVMAFSGCKKNKSCEACNEYKFVYHTNESSVLTGRHDGEFFYGRVNENNVPDILKKHPEDTIIICAELKKIDFVDYNIYDVKEFKCIRTDEE